MSKSAKSRFLLGDGRWWLVLADNLGPFDIKPVVGWTHSDDQDVAPVVPEGIETTELVDSFDSDDRSYLLRDDVGYEQRIADIEKQIHARDTAEKEMLSRNMPKILDALKRHPEGLSDDELASTLGIDGVSRCVTHLLEDGAIEVIEKIPARMREGDRPARAAQRRWGLLGATGKHRSNGGGEES